MDQKKIGKYIADKRKALGLTQVQLAEKLNMSNKSVSKWERGVCLPDVSLYSKLCEVLGISLNEFFAGEDLLEKEIIPKSEETIINISTDSKKNQRRSNLLILTLVIILLVVSGVFFNVLSNKNIFLNKHCIIPLEEGSPEAQTSALLMEESNVLLYRFSVKESYDRMQIKTYWYNEGKKISESCIANYEFSGDHFGEGIIAIIDDEDGGNLEAKVSLEGKASECRLNDSASDSFKLPLEKTTFTNWKNTYNRQIIIPQNKIPVSPIGGETGILLMTYDDDHEQVISNSTNQEAFWPQIREYCSEIEDYDYAVFITVKTWTEGPVIKVWP